MPIKKITRKVIKPLSGEVKKTEEVVVVEKPIEAKAAEKISPSLIVLIILLILAIIIIVYFIVKRKRG